jgi:hypothetical protein
MERFAFGKDPRPVRQRCNKKATRSGRLSVRLVRARQNDGREGMYFEWFVKKRDCDIEGCNSKAFNITMHIDSYYTLSMCAYRYEDFHSEKGLDKPFNMKDTVRVKQKYN